MITQVDVEIQDQEGNITKAHVLQEKYMIYSIKTYLKGSSIRME